MHWLILSRFVGRTQMLIIKNPKVIAKMTATNSDIDFPYILFLLSAPVYIVGAITITLWIMGKI